MNPPTEFDVAFVRWYWEAHRLTIERDPAEVGLLEALDGERYVRLALPPLSTRLSCALGDWWNCVD